MMMMMMKEEHEPQAGAGTDMGGGASLKPCTLAGVTGCDDDDDDDDEGKGFRESGL